MQFSATTLCDYSLSPFSFPLELWELHKVALMLMTSFFLPFLLFSFFFLCTGDNYVSSMGKASSNQTLFRKLLTSKNRWNQFSCGKCAKWTSFWGTTTVWLLCTNFQLLWDDSHKSRNIARPRIIIKESLVRAFSSWTKWKSSLMWRSR